jgi:hypothetical protein
MDGVPNGTTVLLRRGNKTDPGQFERMIRVVVRESYHLEARWMMPEPDSGPGAAFNRDNEMVSLSDLVLAFFEPGQEMTGGTGHVVETAIDRGVPVYSFAQSRTSLDRVGDHDPDAIWQETVRGYFR